ncbi:hypothetical protein A5656_19935 [Mycobacterium gordonae]|jgi:hypothetical protein|uniref:hypothetical protein n=1 Tax=Mycobacterium paragordonae TaxID=1389713 RepID=UPI0007EFBA52|nr:MULTISPECIES: hypothetical protein [Mycobacterium]OBK56182.1 hypothetical protein A5656_19935 [Mycobacterium gordonae]
MTDDSYPPEWDASPPPDPMDPRLGSVLDAIRPTSAERALVADLFAMYVARDPDFATTYQHFWLDRHADKRWHAVFLALLEQFASTAVGAQGEQLSIARAQGDVVAARDDIIEFGSDS